MTVATGVPKGVILIMTTKTVFWYNLPRRTKIFNTSQTMTLKQQNKRGIMEKIIATKNLECYRKENEDGRWRYVIYEKAGNVPVIAFSRKGILHVSKTIPLLIEDYKYYAQVEEITKEVLIMDGGAK